MTLQLAKPQQKLPEEVYVTFTAEINPVTTDALVAVMARCVNEKVKKVHLMLTTQGGTTMHGINLYTMLKAMPFELTIYNTGSVNSIGNAIYLAGDKRIAAPHATFMFHGVGMTVKADYRFEEKDLKEKLDGILADQKKIAAIIAANTSLTDDEVEGLFREAQTKDTDYAVDCGIVHEVKDIEIPDGSTVISLVFQRQTA